MTQLTVLDGTGAPVVIARVVDTGSVPDANCLPVTKSTEDKAVANRIPDKSNLAVTATAAPNTGFTLTLPAAGAGLFHYITGIWISRAAAAALAGANLLTLTSTNLPGNLAWSVGDGMAGGGTQRDVDMVPVSPLKSSVANTATTIILPAPGAAVSWRATVTYYTGT